MSGPELREHWIFEPHAMFGSTDLDDGEPFPFGYISTAAHMPIFELRPVLAYPPEELRAKAELIVTAVNALSAAPQPAPAVGEWRDMPSAPKDGTRVWAYDADHGYEAKVAFIQGEWECIDFDDYGMNVGFYPTHWMPLPAKPVSEGA